MNMTSTFESDFSSRTTNLMELVATVSEFTDSDQETVHVVRHMLCSGNFWYEDHAYGSEVA